MNESEERQELPTPELPGDVYPDSPLKMARAVARGLAPTAMLVEALRRRGACEDGPDENDVRH
jgi:hypothetical protein